MFQSGAPDKGFVGVGVEFDINFIYTRAWVICRDVKTFSSFFRACATENWLLLISSEGLFDLLGRVGLCRRPSRVPQSSPSSMHFGNCIPR
jgi:hypothetical protein